MKPAVIWDLDGVLADNTHRLHFIKPANNALLDWRAFENHAINDVPIQPAIRIYNALQAWSGLANIIVTARNESNEDTTREWLDKAFILDFEMLMMKPKHYQGTSSVEWKRITARKIMHDYKVIMAFEDNPETVAMYRSLGITCYAADPSNWDGPEIHMTSGVERLRIK